jgi:hypothetical protein
MQGYKATQLLLTGLFRICSGNSLFRDKVSADLQDKDSKKLLKDIKTWIKEVVPNFDSLIRSDRLGYWRKPRALAVGYQPLISLLENEPQINTDKFQTALNSII